MSNPAPNDRAQLAVASSDTLRLTAVIALAALIRAAYLVSLSSSILFERPQGDALLHFELAREIAGGDWLGDRVFYYAPLYPYFVAALFSVLGPNVLGVALCQILLSTLDVWVIARIAGRLFGASVAVIAGGLAACYGPFVFYTGFLLKETLGLLLLDGFVLAALGLIERRWWGASFVPGLLLGLAALVRPNLLPLAFAVLVWLWYERRQSSISKRALAVWGFLAGTATAILPITARNFVVGAECVLISAHGGHNFFIGNRPGATGLYEPLRAGGGQSPYEEERDAREIAERATGRSLRASEVSAYWYWRGWREIGKDPANSVRVTLRKLALFWNDYEIPDFQDFYFLRHECPVLWLAPLTLGLVAPLAGYGLVASRRQWRECLLLYVVIVGVVISVVPFFVFARYRLPVVPIVIVFAGQGLVAIARRVAAREWMRLASVSAAVIALGVVLNWPIYRPIDFLATSYFNLGNLNRAAGRTEAAITALQEAVRLNPDYRKPHRMLAEIHFAAERWREAIPLLGRAAAMTVEQVPDDPDVCYMLGICYLKVGERPQAERIISVGSVRWPEDQRFREVLGQWTDPPQGERPQ